MSRSRRLLFVLAAAGSCALPLLWSPQGHAALPGPAAPGAVAVGCLWLALGCLACAGPAASAAELALLAILLAPGLLVTLSSHADLGAREAYAMAARVLLALALHGALRALSAELGRRAARRWLAAALVPAAVLLFALALGPAPLALSAAAAGCAWSLLLLRRSRLRHG